MIGIKNLVYLPLKDFLRKLSPMLSHNTYSSVNNNKYSIFTKLCCPSLNIIIIYPLYLLCHTDLLFTSFLENSICFLHLLFDDFHNIIKLDTLTIAMSPPSLPFIIFLGFNNFLSPSSSGSS